MAGTISARITRVQGLTDKLVMTDRPTTDAEWDAYMADQAKVLNNYNIVVRELLDEIMSLRQWMSNLDAAVDGVSDRQATLDRMARQVMPRLVN